MGDTELEAAARAVVDSLARVGVRGCTPVYLAANIDALAAALPSPPEPLKVGDTVTRDDADRVPVGAILRTAVDSAVVINELGWEVTGEPGATTPDGIGNPSFWPMTVLWLPEPSDAEVGS